MFNKVKNNLIYISVIITLTIVLIIAVEFSSALFFKSLALLSSIYSHGRFNNYADCRVESPAYVDKVYANKIYKEYRLLESQYIPYAIWKFKEFHGKCINIDKNGLRVSIPKGTGKSNKRLFFFGGSTMWGVGVDDSNTIPSIVSRYLNKDNYSTFEVFNYGQVGYVSTQELIQLILELQKGNVPDIVIFYDGVNDIYASIFSPGITSYHENYEQIKSRMEAKGIIKGAYFNSSFFNLVNYIKNRIRKGASGQDSKEDIRVKDAIDGYLANLQLVQKLSEKYDFKFIAFWQPVVLIDRKVLTEYEKIEKTKMGEKLIRIYTKAHENIGKRHLDGIKLFDLSNIFENEKGDIYIDFAHLENKGNSIVAKKIFEVIKEE